MGTDEIKFGDWTRFFWGEAPAGFYIEIVIRAFFVYLLLMVCMRLMGKRMASQLSRNEMAALVSLAAAIGIPILDATRGLLAPLIIGIVVVIFQRGMALWAYRDKEFEKTSQGDLSVLVCDSVMQLGEMQKARITRERLFGQLRSEGLCHLGEVARLYMEASGSFTIVKSSKVEPGLLVLPYSDTEFIEDKVDKTQKKVCYNCGNPKPVHLNGRTNIECNNCGKTNWTEAVV